jgi:hypothetical protein
MHKKINKTIDKLAWPQASYFKQIQNSWLSYSMHQIQFTIFCPIHLQRKITESELERERKRESQKLTAQDLSFD